MTLRPRQVGPMLLGLFWWPHPCHLWGSELVCMVAKGKGFTISLPMADEPPSLCHLIRLVLSLPERLLCHHEGALHLRLLHIPGSPVPGHWHILLLQVGLDAGCSVSWTWRQTVSRGWLLSTSPPPVLPAPSLHHGWPGTDRHKTLRLPFLLLPGHGASLPPIGSCTAPGTPSTSTSSPPSSCGGLPCSSRMLSSSQTSPLTTAQCQR